MLQLAIIVLYFLVMVALGLASRKRASTPDGFFVMDRRGSTFLITGSLVATIIGGSATVGLAGLGFTRGLTGVWWLLVGSIGLLVLGVFLAGKVRRFGLYTLPQLIEKQYGDRVALAASVLIVIAWLGVIAGQIVATGKILTALGIGSPVLWMVLFTVVFVSYTLIGGQRADISTDVVQAVLIYIGIFATFGVMVTRMGGWSGLTAAMKPEQLAFPLSPKFGALDLVSYLLLIGLTYVVGPDMYSRLFSARDGRTARASVLWTAFLIVPLGFAITLVGMGVAVLFPGVAPEQAFPALVTGMLPPLAGGLVLAALVSATMSSADSCLLSASTILTVDILKRVKPGMNERQVLSLARWGIVVVGLLSLMLSLLLKGVISALLFAYTVYTAGVILPVLAGFYRDRLKVTPAGAMAAIVGGGGVALASKLLNIRYLDLGSLAISAVLLLAVSAADNRLKRSRYGAQARDEGDVGMAGAAK